MSKKPARILVVDDDEAVRFTLRLMLERSNYTVEEAANGNTGLAKFREASYDLVITDVFMPEKDGIELVQEIKKEAPNAKIVFISGNADQQKLYSRVTALLKADATLQKPFSMKALLDTVRNVLEK